MSRTLRPDAMGPGLGTGAMKQTPNPDAYPLTGTRLAEYVTVLRAREQWRDRIQSNNTALAAEHEYRGRQRHGRRAQPSAEREAEL
jgi:hypothetical protein